jgi:hypothetical protein
MVGESKDEDDELFIHKSIKNLKPKDEIQLLAMRTALDSIVWKYNN